MTHLLAYAAGFASGWVVRSTVDSSRSLVVGVLAGVIGAVDRTKRFVAMEREHLEDLFAEANARYEAKRTFVRPNGESANGSDPKEYVQ